MATTRQGTVNTSAMDGEVDYLVNADDQLLKETATFYGSYAGQSYTTRYGHYDPLNPVKSLKGYDPNGSMTLWIASASESRFSGTLKTAMMPPASRMDGGHRVP